MTYTLAYVLLLPLLIQKKILGSCNIHSKCDGGLPLSMNEWVKHAPDTGTRDKAGFSRKIWELSYLLGSCFEADHYGCVKYGYKFCCTLEQGATTKYTQSRDGSLCICITPHMWGYCVTVMWIYLIGGLRLGCSILTLEATHSPHILRLLFVWDWGPIARIWMRDKKFTICNFNVWL